MKITRLDPQTRDSTADSWTLSRACRRLVIGRAAPADIRLESPAISPQHAELCSGAAFTIRDLASINGIALRGRILRSVLRTRRLLRRRHSRATSSLRRAARRARLLTVTGILGAVASPSSSSGLPRRQPPPEARPRTCPHPAPVSIRPSENERQYAQASLLFDKRRPHRRQRQRPQRRRLLMSHRPQPQPPRRNSSSMDCRKATAAASNKLCLVAAGRFRKP